MKNWFKSLSIYYKTFFIGSLVLIVAFGAAFFCYFNGMYDVPNGVLAGGFLGMLSNFLLGLSDKHDFEHKKPTLAIIISISRFLLIAILLLVSAILEYRLNYKLFNLFATVGGYLISPATFVVIALMERKNV